MLAAACKTLWTRSSQGSRNDLEDSVWCQPTLAPASQRYSTEQKKQGSFLAEGTLTCTSLDWGEDLFR